MTHFIILVFLFSFLGFITLDSMLDSFAKALHDVQKKSRP